MAGEVSTPLNARRAGSTSAVWGYVIVLAAGISFVIAFYTMFLSKLPLHGLHDTALPPTSDGNGLLQAIEQDVYYCFLIPLTIPVSILAFYSNWVSLKFFRHN